MRTVVLGRGVIAYTPNPVGREQPGVGHARKPGDPLLNSTLFAAERFAGVKALGREAANDVDLCDMRATHRGRR
jgi:hypothetical protein